MLINAMTIKARIRRTIFIAILVQLTCWDGSGSSKSVFAADPVANSQLKIKPLPDMLDILDVPIEGKLVGVFRCDFAVHQVETVHLNLRAIKNQELVELGEVAIDTLELPDKELDGTFYIAFFSHGGDVGSISQMLSIGISTESGRKYSRVKDFTIPANLTFKTSATLLNALTVADGKEVTIWGVCYKSPEKETRHKTVQELIADKVPFESMEPTKIIEATKSMNDAVVVYATVNGTK